MADAFSLTKIPVEALHQELARRKAQVGALMKTRARLAAQLDVLSNQLEAAGKMPVGASAGRRRPTNKMNLVQAITKVLAGKTMSVSEVMRGVQAAGYRSNAASFRVIVNGTLAKHKAFKRVGWGKYAMR